MHTPTLGIIITTTNRNIERVKNLLLPQLSEADEVIVSHQIFEDGVTPETLSDMRKFHPHVQYSVLYSQWISKNRNNGIRLLTADIGHLCDDDLLFLPNYASLIRDAHMRNSNAIITFQVLNDENEYQFRVKEGYVPRYKLGNIFCHGITFKRKAIHEKWLQFDENFWLGMPNFIGEETLFLDTCHRAWIRTYHINIPIVRHPNESTGTHIDMKTVKARTHLYKHMFGWFSTFFFIPVFAYKLRFLYRKKCPHSSFSE